MTEHGCPNCSASIELAAPACPYCGVVVEERLAARAWERQVASARPRVRRPPRKSRRRLWTAAAAAGLALGGAVWLAVPEPGLPLPQTAREDPGSGFAFVMPPGWREATSWGKSPAAAANLTDGFAVIQVKLAPRSALSAARGARGAAALVAEEFGTVEARVISRADTRIDGLPAVRIAAAGPRVRMPSSNRGRIAGLYQQPAPEYESLPLGALLVVVPAAGRAFLIKIFSDEGHLEAQRRSVEGFLATFRVTRRPAWSRLL